MIIIRKYEEQDRDMVRKICQDTAHKPFRKKAKHRESIALMYVDYYINEEPENVFVAYDTEKAVVAGYVVCHTDQEKYDDLVKHKYNKLIRKQCFYLGWFNELARKETLKLYKKYGIGGFHINVSDDYQGYKIGPKLLTTMGLHLKSLGFHSLYLVTKNKHTQGYGFYRHFGFEEIHKSLLGYISLSYDLANIEENEKKYLMGENK